MVPDSPGKVPDSHGMGVKMVPGTMLLWRHSDIKNLAYPFVRNLFDMIVFNVLE